MKGVKEKERMKQNFLPNKVNKIAIVKDWIKQNWKTLLFCFIIVYFAAAVGAAFTSKSVNSNWYRSVSSSSFLTPPGWIFPVVWNVLFFLIALSLFLSWTSENTTRLKKKRLAIALEINLFLNAFWSYLFFYLRRPNFAFFELLALLFSIFFLIFTTWKIDKKFAYLLFPYAAWVLFAGVLNFWIAFF